MLLLYFCCILGSQSWCTKPPNLLSILITPETELHTQEMRFMTGRLKEKDEENEIESDWKFAAMVIDR